MVAIMRSNIKALIVSMLLFITTSGFLIFGYLWVDTSLSYNYLLESPTECDSNSVELMRSLLEKDLLGIDEDKLMSKLETSLNVTDSNIVLKKDMDKQIIWLENLSFQFENGRLKKVGLGRDE